MEKALDLLTMFKEAGKERIEKAINEGVNAFEGFLNNLRKKYSYHNNNTTTAFLMGGRRF